METKQCKKCGLQIPLSKFSPRKPRPSAFHDGYENSCLYCRAKHDQKHRKWKQKYKPIDERTLIKIRETEKHYFDEKEKVYIKFKVGYKRVKNDKIRTSTKTLNVSELRAKYFEMA